MKTGTGQTAYKYGYFKLYDIAFNLLETGELTHKEYIVYSYLCRRADENALCYPSIRTIEKETGVSKSTVQRAIKKLENLKMINVYQIQNPRDPRKPLNVYEINPPEIWKVYIEEKEENRDYIDSEIFKEFVMEEYKKQKLAEGQRILFKEGMGHYEDGLKQGLEDDFSKKVGHKEYINKKETKEKKIHNENEAENLREKKLERIKKLEEEKEKLNLNEIEKELSQPPRSERKSAKAESSAKSQKSRIETDFTKLEAEDYTGKITAKVRWKLYSYRQFYKDILDKLEPKLKRLKRDDVLFFLINTEDLRDKGKISLRKIIKLIIYADRNKNINSPIGWLIERFSVGKGRFYFLLSKPDRKTIYQNRITVNKENEKMKTETTQKEENHTIVGTNHTIERIEEIDEKELKKMALKIAYKELIEDIKKFKAGYVNLRKKFEEAGIHFKDSKEFIKYLTMELYKKEELRFIQEAKKELIKSEV